MRGPTERSEGGFRLCAEAEMRRLALVRRIRLLGFCLEDMLALLEVMEELPESSASEPAADEEAYEELVDGLRKYGHETDALCGDLRGELAPADFARSPPGRLARLTEAAPSAHEADAARGPAR